MSNKENNLRKLECELVSHGNKEKAQILSHFFKTGRGEYGEGDIFLGITVPVSRNIARKYQELSFEEIAKLFESKFHEERLVALLILVQKYKLASLKKDLVQKKKIYNFYLTKTKYINNWDLVDLSSHYIVGNYLIDKDRKILDKLAKSKNLWEKRIAIISTFAFIYKGEADYTFRIVRILLNDKHDLIHKACGWMLREVGKRVSGEKLESFLKENSKKMPRTMLRYAIEKLPEEKRKYYLEYSKK